MDIVVCKFGGSSLANNNRLKQVANRIISVVNSGKKAVVILSAQGKTTDKLLNQAKQLSKNINKRELDMLLSVGEQISCSKEAILLSEMGYKAVSLTGWQVGIYTDSVHTNAKICTIYTDRILKELQINDIVFITGFQGIDFENNITTIGRNGSDTSAIAITAALNVDTCYIYTDVDGIYDKDPKKCKDAKKINKLNYLEMKEILKNGGKVLHSRCIDIAEKYKIKIVILSTFTNTTGSIIS